MSTDEEKTRLAKLLKDVEVPETNLSDRCFDLVKEFRKKFGESVDEEEVEMSVEEKYENPYKVDKDLLEEIERKLRLLSEQNKRSRRELSGNISDKDDPDRPWRTNSSKEKLLRINNDIKRYHEKGLEKCSPLPDNEMQALVQQCQDEAETANKVTPEQVFNSIKDARQNLPNFQYRKIYNSTALEISPFAHKDDNMTNNLTQDIENVIE